MKQLSKVTLEAGSRAGTRNSYWRNLCSTAPKVAPKDPSRVGR